MNIQGVVWFYIKDRKMLKVRPKGKTVFFSPGGKCEDGETDEQAVMREVKEEVGVDLIPETIRFAETFSAPAHGQPEGTMVVLRAYFADFSGEIAAQGEIEELAWLNSADADRVSETGRLMLAWLKEHDRID